MTPMLEKVRVCRDPKMLKQWIKNAAAQHNDELERAARRRLYEVLPIAEPGTFEHDVWTSIHALEDLESLDRGKSIRLQRTRNLIATVGEQECVERLLLKPNVSSGYAMLIRHQLPELLFEAIALRHSSRFGTKALANAKARLDSAMNQRVGIGSAPE